MNLLSLSIISVKETLAHVLSACPVAAVAGPALKAGVLARAAPPAINEFAVIIPVTFAPAAVTVSIPTLSTLVSTLEATV